MNLSTDLYKTKYVRLQTSVREGALEMIKQNTYILKLNNEVIKIHFGKFLEDYEVFHIGQHFGNFLDIEEVEGIYYITIYLDEFLIKVCPLKFLSVDKLVFYGFDEENPNIEIAALLQI